jgi:hypothetical protein
MQETKILTELRIQNRVCMKLNTKYLILLFVAIYSLPFNGFGQGKYGNEWIDYSKTYWKFKVSKDGIFRIQKAALDAAGIPTTTLADNFTFFTWQNWFFRPFWSSAAT